jgi:hypothetical protein
MSSWVSSRSILVGPDSVAQGAEIPGVTVREQSFVSAGAQCRSVLNSCQTGSLNPFLRRYRFVRNNIRFLSLTFVCALAAVGAIVLGSSYSPQGGGLTTEWSRRAIDPQRSAADL